MPAQGVRQATITVAGTVLSGTDGNPDSNPPGQGRTFGGGSDLTGEPFTITIRVSSNDGTYSSAACSNGSLYSSTISGTSTTSPATATLQIGSGTFTYGSYPLSGIYWLTGRTAQESCSSYNSINFGWSEGYNGAYSGASGLGNANMYTATDLPSADLFSTVFPVQVLGAPYFPFHFTVYQGQTLIKYAYGELVPQYFSVQGEQSPLQFVPVTPCRLVDTRNPAGPFGGPELAGDTSRVFAIPNSACNIPSNAAAYSLNVTVVPDSQLGYLTIWPTGQSQPLVSTLNSDGRVKANAAMVPAGSGGSVSVFVTDPTQLILDIDGYFVPATSTSLQFYPVTPCRIADTRQGSGFSGSLGPPFLTGAAVGRSFPILSSSCNIPSSAKAYSLNFTAVPHGPLGFITVWPTGQPQPLVSTLNASTGTVTANAALVPTGDGGDISVFAANDTDLLIDINGYFAPPGSGGLSLYTVAPCRARDTRTEGPPFHGTIVTNVAGNACMPQGAGAQAFVLNATVVPPGPLGYLSLWPDGEPQPLVSTLNAFDGAVTSDMAIVPTTNGAIDAFASDPAQLILDISGYFAP